LDAVLPKPFPLRGHSNQDRVSSAFIPTNQFWSVWFLKQAKKNAEKLTEFATQRAFRAGLDLADARCKKDTQFLQSVSFFNKLFCL
jgi:hypothetical protein